MGWSATTIVRAAVAIGALASGLVLLAAHTIPTPRGSWTVEGDEVRLEGSGAVMALRSSAGRFDLEPLDLIDEPDVMETWGDLDRFFARQTELRRVLDGVEVVAVRPDGTTVPVEVGPRPFGELHWTFYSQLLAALLAWLAGLVTFAYSDRGVGARAYAISAVGIAIVLWPACVYTTRGLAIDGGVFRALSLLDHAGGHLYANAFLGLFLVYPVRLVKRLTPLIALGVAAFVLEVTRALPVPVVGFYTTMSIYTLAFLTTAVVQWWRARRDPVTRATFGWVVFFGLLGMASFVLLIMVPLLLGMDPVVSQGVVLPLYALTFAGVSLGVLRFRLFELDRWWFRAWSWVLGGTVLLLADVLLMSLFDLEHHQSLLVAVAVVGWAYFPARQWILGRLAGTARDELTLDVGDLAAARDPDELARMLEQKLRDAFAPLRLERHPGALAEPQLSPTGDVLRVPRGDGHFVCRFRDQGRSLYRPRDLARAARLVAVCDSVERALRAHDAGQTEERARIRRDLHDDMGASIIRIIHATEDPEVGALAKHSMRDLRNVLLALAPEPEPVEAVLADLRAELAALSTEARPVQIEITGHASWELGGRRRANLVRVLREAVTNAIHHGEGPIDVAIELDADRLRGVVENPVLADPSPGTGLGLSSASARVTEIGGTLEWRQDEGVFRLVVEVPREAS